MNMELSRNINPGKGKIRSLAPMKNVFPYDAFGNKTLDYSNIKPDEKKMLHELDSDEMLPEIPRNGFFGKKGGKITLKGRMGDIKEINRKLRIKIIVLENRIYNLEEYISTLTVIFFNI